MTNRYIATTFAVLLQTTAFASAANENIMGWGGYLCSRWIEDHPKTAASWLELSDTGRSQAQWVLGYLQGISRLPGEFYSVDDGSIVFWINGYCALNPLDNIYTAAQALVRDLRER